jgi:hypothetical protein
MESGVSAREKGRTNLVHRWFQDKGTGAGVYNDGTRQKLIFSLGEYTTVYQEEVYAIKACAVKNLDRNYRNRSIYIPSDSQAAIKALDKYQITSKLVWDCHQSLTQLAEQGSTDMCARS